MQGQLKKALVVNISVNQVSNYEIGKGCGMYTAFFL